MSAARTLWRIELRELLRHRRRSLLVLALVALPVAALVCAAGLLDSSTPTLEERRAQRFGAADLRIDLVAPEQEALARALLPAGARVQALELDAAELCVGGLRVRVPRLACDPHGLASGLVRVVEGRAPRADGEIGLSASLALALGRAVGDELRGEAGERMRVVGLVVQPEETEAPLVLAAEPVGPRASVPRARRSLLVALPAASVAPALERTRLAGLSVAARSVVGPDEGFVPLALTVLGGFCACEAALVMGAAFAVGARRRRRELGLLAAAGASRRALVAAMVASALGLALLGGLLGLLLGTLAARTLHPWLDGWTGRENGALELEPSRLGFALLLGLLAAGSAALVPSLRATAVPVREALGSRRPPPARTRGGFARAALLSAVGLGLVAWSSRPGTGVEAAGVLGGSLLAVLGLCSASAPLLAACASCAAPLPLAWRLALRDAGRMRARNAPVVVAVLAALSVAILVGALAESVERSAARARAREDARLWVAGGAAEPLAHELAALLPDAFPLGPERVDSSGAARWSVRLAAPLSTAELTAVRTLVAARASAKVELVADSAPEPPALGPLLAACVVLAATVVWIASALSTLESRADSELLDALGASPALARRVGAARAAWLALLGGTLALPAGWVPALALVRLANLPLELAPPRGAIACALVALPLLAWSGAYAGRAWRERRRLARKPTPRAHALARA